MRQTWARHASTRQQLVRKAYDTYRWIEQRALPSVSVPRGGHPPARLHRSGDTTQPVIALTFDDGPDPELTPPLLDLLGERGIKATFYVIGRNAQRHPEIVRRAFDEGHEIGNHTWSHRFLTTQRTRSIVEELVKTDDVVSGIIGESPATLRPPYGAVTPSLAAWARHQFGYETMLWSVDSKDYEGADATEIVSRLVDQTTAGSIILCHDIVPATLEAMPEALDRLLDRGLRFVTIGELQNASEG